MKQFEGRSFFVKDEKELEKVRKLIKKHGFKERKSLTCGLVKNNENKHHNHLIFVYGEFGLSAEPYYTKNYSISTLQRLLKQC